MKTLLIFIVRLFFTVFALGLFFISILSFVGSSSFLLHLYDGFGVLNNILYGIGCIIGAVIPLILAWYIGKLQIIWWKKFLSEE